MVRPRGIGSADGYGARTAVRAFSLSHVEHARHRSKGPVSSFRGDNPGASAPYAGRR